MSDNSEPLVVMIRVSWLPENSDDVRDLEKRPKKIRIRGKFEVFLTSCVTPCFWSCRMSALLAHVTMHRDLCGLSALDGRCH